MKLGLILLLLFGDIFVFLSLSLSYDKNLGESRLD